MVWISLTLVFAVASRGLTHHYLVHNRYQPTQALQADSIARIQVQASVLAIEVGIKTHLGFSNVSVKTTDSPLKTLELEFPLLDIPQLESAIAQELSLDPAVVQQLARYQLEPSALKN